MATRIRRLDIAVGDLVEIDGRRYEVVPDRMGGVTLEPPITPMAEIDAKQGTRPASAEDFERLTADMPRRRRGVVRAPVVRRSGTENGRIQALCPRDERDLVFDSGHGGRKSMTSLRYSDDAADLALLELAWNALQEHHTAVVPALGGETPPRGLADAWDRRRAKYEGWLKDPETFFVIAERGAVAGYAFVTVAAGFAAWATGRIANLETLSVVSEHRRSGLGAQLLDAAWSKLAERGVREMAITAAISNVDSHRFYERHGFAQAFVVYYGTRDD